MSSEREILKQALPYPTFDLGEKTKPQKTSLQAFTTEPRTRRHVKQSISRNRAKDFMEHLWRRKLKHCSYDTLEWEFTQFYGTNEARVIEKYIGRPQQKRYYGTRTIRRTSDSGDTKTFTYSDDRRIEAKKGLMEKLGYLTLNKKARVKDDRGVILHHERMHYFTEQAELTVSPQTPLPERVDERPTQKVSKDDLCVIPIGHGQTRGKDVVVEGVTRVTERRERER